jgi:hypothetical protein
VCEDGRAWAEVVKPHRRQPDLPGVKRSRFVIGTNTTMPVK